MSGPVFPFIVASPRSGTTLLQAMLNAHPELAVPPEAHFLVPLARLVRHTDGLVDAGHLTRLLAGRELFALWALPQEEVESALREARPTTYPEAMRAVYALYARRQGKRRYGDKTPKHVENLSFLAEAFPEARFIHLIRDGRDVTSSFLAHRLGPRNAAEGAIRWRRTVAGGRRDGRRLGPERYFEVRYEELVEDPRRHLQAVCGFIDLEFDDAMLSYHRDAERLLPNPRLRSLHTNLSLPPRSGLRDWRREMTPSQVAVFEALAGDLLQELGYARAVPLVPWQARARAGRDWLGFQAFRALRRAERLVGGRKARPRAALEDQRPGA
jgi:hypothetical protein